MARHGKKPNPADRNGWRPGASKFARETGKHAQETDSLVGEADELLDAGEEEPPADDKKDGE